MAKLPNNPPVVIQTSALDCGPASLSSLLRGIGAPGSYEALRDLCGTDVDGTSIDALERVAVGAGGDAEQLVLPAEHILAKPDDYLPAIAIVLLPDGFPHFVVVWRRIKRSVLVMDPAVGMRRIPHRDFVAMLYRHCLPVPADAWREWAGSDIFTSALDRRMEALGIGKPPRSTLIASALTDQGPRGLAVLDAAIRERETDGHYDRRHGLQVDALTWDDDATAPAYSCTPGQDGSVLLHGAVIVRARTWAPEKADPSLLTRLGADDASPPQVVSQVLSGALAWLVPFAIAAAITGGFILAEAISVQPLASGLRGARLRPYQVAIIVTTVLTGFAAYALTYLAGRQLERRLRAAWWALVARLPDAFVRTRPTFDIVERGHLLHRVRELPLYVLRSLFSLTILVGACTAICVEATRAIPFALLLLITTLAVPALTFRRIADADFRARQVSGTLARFTYDALLGAEAVGAFSAGPAIQYEQRGILDVWMSAQRRLIGYTVAARVGTGVPGALLAAGAVSAAHAGKATVLLVAVLAVLSIDSSEVIVESLRSLAESRSSIARAAGPLSTKRVSEPVSPGATPEELAIVDVSVRMGSATVLGNVTVAVPAGAHVAVVGVSGSGKSSLLATLLGWLEPSSGSISWGSQPLDAVALRRLAAWSAPETRLWNETLHFNVFYGASPGSKSPDERLLSAEASRLADQLDRRSDSRLGDGGGGLSDGEAQRVRLARALGRPAAPLVVLDEPFRGLERDRRRRLLRTARDTWCRSTFICAMHDISDALDFDQVLVFEQGSVVETGSPSELVANAESRFSMLLAAEQGDLFAEYRPISIAPEETCGIRSS